MDPSIFEQETFEGNGHNLFGEIDEIVHKGRFYSLNFGFDMGLGQYDLLVLDTKERSLTFHSFIRTASNKWKSDSKLLSDRLVSFEAEYFASKVFDFIAKMKNMIPKLNLEEAEDVYTALLISTDPLINHLTKISENALAKISDLDKARGSVAQEVRRVIYTPHK